MPHRVATGVTSRTYSRASCLHGGTNSLGPCCPRSPASLQVTVGRLGSAKFNKLGSGSVSAPEFAREWSRGCRKPHKSFWSCPWPQSWPLARRNPKWLRSWKLPPNRPTPASTSKNPPRAWRLSPAGPAATPCLPPSGSRPSILSLLAATRRPGDGQTSRLSRGAARSPVRC